LTFPVKAGDEVLIVFASRCIDSWWQSGGVQVPIEERMHDLSDGFAILSPTSQPKKLSSVSTSNAQLRTESGGTYIEVTPNGKIRLIAEAEIELAAPSIKINGAVTQVGGVNIDGKAFGTHQHSDPQGGTTGPPL
jgi:predicted transcriptional regulator